jgi:hypothetical protein
MPMTRTALDCAISEGRDLILSNNPWRAALQGYEPARKGRPLAGEPARFTLRPYDAVRRVLGK